MAKDLSTHHGKSGLLPIDPNEGLIALERALTLNSANLMIAPLDWIQYLKSLGIHPNWLADFSSGIESKSIVEDLMALDSEDKMPFLKSHIIKIVKEVLGLTSSRSIDEEKGFFDMGLDSLMAVELKNRLQASFGSAFKLSTTLIFDYSSINQLCKHISVGLNIVDLKESPIASKKEIREGKIDAEVDAIDEANLWKSLKEEL